MLKKPAKADEYRRLALEATAHALASGLDHVRLKHQTAADQWTMLALLEEDRRHPAAARAS